MIGEIKRRARESLSGHWWIAILFCLAVSAISNIPSFVTSGSYTNTVETLAQG